MYENVMIIDDSHVDRFIVQKIVERANFASLTTSFGCARTALRYLQDQSSSEQGLPDLIFLDINMPDMNGFDFLDAFAKLGNDFSAATNIVMLSSSLHPEDKARALAYPFVRDFVNKPLNIQHLQQLTRSGDEYAGGQQ